MKNKLMLLLFVLVFADYAFAQNSETTDEQMENVEIKDKFALSFNLGGNTGGSQANKLYSTNIGVDISLLKGISKNLMVGGNVGAGNAFSKKGSTEGDLKYLMIGASFRLYTDNNKFFIGGNGGYSFGLDDGGWYYQPRFGFDVCEHFGVNVSYLEINDAIAFSAVTVGLEYSF